MSNNTSVESRKHPYMRIKFWMSNQFWHEKHPGEPRHSEKSKEYLDNWLIRETENTRKLTSLL